jgi:antitoxin component YwqK of YwqJK toxin-antitoxin module
MKKEVVQWRGKFILLFFISTFTFLFISCSEKNKYAKEYYYRDGLICYYGSTDGFNGKIVDTLKNRVVEFEVADGKKNGIFKIYFLDGKVEMKGTIKENKNDGKWQYFYPNGTIESEGNFKNDQPIDKWTWYYESGKIKETGYFINGRREGVWVFYDEKGNITLKTIFKDGEKVTDVRFDNFYS